jgi:hypothetical protein
MPELAKLRSHLMSLVTRGQALSSIEVIESAGSESAYTAALDWILEIRSRSESGAMERRRGRVDVRLAKHEKRWRITSLTPVDFFAPPKPAASASAPSPQTSAAE